MNRKLEHYYLQSTTINIKEAKLLIRLASYFGVNSILIGNTLKNTLGPIMRLHTSNCKNVNTITEEQYDLILIDSSELVRSKSLLNKLIDAMHNDSILILRNIYVQSENETLWRSLHNHKAFNVSIDLYTHGLLFIRKEQVKEHFVIRW
ncbi:hypothetical protein ACE939_09515 [Aquimarina sp. W85]|uniref:hypothetical protein n=1 Tax=Aquimarina rhodophyticola TaxID=3342246 RepID=UPI0036716CEB